MVCTPAASALVAQVAVPATPRIWAAQPAMATPPSSNATLPVRVPDAGPTAVTFAVKVTVTPVLDGFSDDTTLVVVAPWLTVCVKGADVLAAKLASPL